MTLPVGSLLYFDTGTDLVNPTWTKVSEHNRSSASLEIERIEKTQRMSNGSLGLQIRNNLAQAGECCQLIIQ